jgi:signal transduction histidine kinase
MRTIVSLKSLLIAYNDMVKDNNKIEHKAISLAHKPSIVYIITALMAATSLLYFYVAYEDYQELLQVSSSSDSKDAAAAAAADDTQATRNEMTFFLIVAISYIPISIWMLKVKHNSKIPYIISIVGSAALIVFYILTRVIDIPSIGLQTDVGTIDITTKIIQGAIVAISSFLVVSVILRRNRLENNSTTTTTNVYGNRKSIEKERRGGDRKQ